MSLNRYSELLLFEQYKISRSLYPMYVFGGQIHVPVCMNFIRIPTDINIYLGWCRWCPGYLYRISNEFSFHTMYYETSCVFYIPEPLARGYKTHNEFHNTSYGMKIHLRFFLSHELTRNEQITRWNRRFPRIGDGLRRGLLRLDNKFAWCSVITIRQYPMTITFHYFWNQKHQEEHVLV